MVTQSQINTSIQPRRIIYGIVQLLNYNMQMVDELSGVIVDKPYFTEDSTSDIRRTFQMTMVQLDKSYDIATGSKIWLDKYVKILVGIKDEHTGEIIYTNMGIYMINNPNRTYDAMSNSITLTCVDLMAKMTGLRNGNLTGMTYTIPGGSNVRSAIISTIALAGFTNYSCSECPITVPNDINIDAGGTIYDVLSALRDILPQYQMYFDRDGVFHYELTPSGKNETPVADDVVFKPNLISYNVDTSFENVKNSITVIGKTHDISNFGTATISGSSYVLSITSVTSLYDGLKIGFVAPSKVTNPTINLNSYGAKNLVDEYGAFAVLGTGTNVYYVAKYQSASGTFLFMGEVTPMATVEETNPDSPFYVNGTIGRIRKVLNGGEYDNIYMTSLALARAKWELYNYARIQDNITLTCVPLYWLDTNTVIELTLPNNQGTSTKQKYIVKRIQTGFGVGETQTITAMKYYSYYDD